MPTAVVVTDQVPFGEGPVWCPDGTLVCASVSHGTLLRIEPDAGTVTVVADTGGGANAAALADDGSFLVTQNGGFDLSAYPHVGQPSVRWCDPGLQHARRDGSVTSLTSKPLQAPNDLVVARDGTVYFTDPEKAPPIYKVSRVLAYHLDGTLEEVAGGWTYVNGIAFDPDQTTLVVVADDRQLLRLADFGRGEREPAIADIGEAGGDGFCLDVDGRYYVASTGDHGIRVVDPDGSVVEFLPIPGDGLTTNCCFGGDDLRTLYATDAIPGHVVAWEGMPTPGLPLPTWPGLDGSSTDQA
ncbi:MAG: gluconolactonase [Frankiaceae bacterium]|nr:gluconolactonase [Frankiaceae bacterium]